MPTASNSNNSSINRNSNNKKLKTTTTTMTTESKTKNQQQEVFDKVQSYILACPDVSADHPAIKAALKGLEQERKRQERDYKLQQKFSQSTTTANENSAVEAPVMVANPPKNNTNHGNTTKKNNGDDQQDDWQDLKANSSEDVNMETSGELVDPSGNGDGASAGGNQSFLGDRLAEQVISMIAQQHSVSVKTPLSAIAVALHAAMRSSILGFACTGIPDEEGAAASAAAGGFAAPVRELPSTQLLPLDWEQRKDCISLRYRKKGTGSVVLEVEEMQQPDGSGQATVVKVTLVPSAAPEPPSESLTFALPEHFNLDSFNRAAASSSKVPPALHYKALSSLLTKFVQTFDLGCVQDGGDGAIGASNSMPYVDTSIQHHPSAAVPHLAAGGNGMKPPNFPTNEPAPPQFPSMVCNPPSDPRGGVPTTIEAAFPGLHDPSRPGGRGGDFAMDKGLPGMPGGAMPGDGVPGSGAGLLGDPSHAGNLMGPNHPMFAGTGVGPHGMVPRYDPVFGPPGGPGDLTQQKDPNQFARGDPQKKQRMDGNPNPDHLPPPGGFNMFS